MSERVPRTWQVGALCRALADALEARFNPVTVQGEISGFSRASSGHSYFSLKDASAQIRCVMFKRVGAMLDFLPRDGQLVELRGRVTLYEPRGDLQLMVESLRQAGAGVLFEQFLRLKAKLEAEGLFSAERKRPLPLMPRGIGVVTSLGAAALRDVVSTLRRRAPHVPVVLAAAAVQGAGAPAELVQALAVLGAMSTPRGPGNDGEAAPVVDVILLVRGGGSIEDLWAFNDESLARAIARSPIPVVCGVGHETDFTIADFVADLRAPTPTAAAELVAGSREDWLRALAGAAARLRDTVRRQLDVQSQRLDAASSRLGRPSSLVGAQRFVLSSLTRRMRHAAVGLMARQGQDLERVRRRLPEQVLLGLERRRSRLGRAQAQLVLLDPSLVLQRGYAWLVDGAGHTLTSPDQTRPGQSVHATLAGGVLELMVPQRD